MSLENAKARAAAHGMRITAATVNAARRLLERQDAPIAAEKTGAPQKAEAAEKRGRERLPRATDGGVDAEALIRQIVGRLQSQGNAETERLRAAMRKAIALLLDAAG